MTPDAIIVGLGVAMIAVLLWKIFSQWMRGSKTGDFQGDPGMAALGGHEGDGGHGGGDI